MHLYFNYTDKLSTSTRLAGLSVDTRGKNGYIIANPTPDYDWIIAPWECATSDVPEWMIKELCAGKKSKRSKKDSPKNVKRAESQSDQDGFFYPTSSSYVHKIENILKLLPKNHCNNFDDWFKVTCAMKSVCMNNDSEAQEIMFKLWDDWSSKSSNYNCSSNMRIWNSIVDPRLNVNYLLNLLNGNKSNPYKKFRFQKTKHYDPLANLRTDLKKVTDGKNQYINLQQFLPNYNAILAKAPTGSGKTTQAKQIIKKQLKKEPFRNLVICGIACLIS